MHIYIGYKHMMVVVPCLKAPRAQPKSPRSNLLCHLLHQVLARVRLENRLMSQPQKLPPHHLQLLLLAKVPLRDQQMSPPKLHRVLPRFHRQLQVQPQVLARHRQMSHPLHPQRLHQHHQRLQALASVLVRRQPISQHRRHPKLPLFHPQLQVQVQVPRICQLENRLLPAQLVILQARLRRPRWRHFGMLTGVKKVENV